MLLLLMYTNSVEVIQNPDLAVVVIVVVVVQNVVVFHIHAHILLHALAVCFLELVRMLQILHSVSVFLHTENQLLECYLQKATTAVTKEQ